ncbi:hypothetical protein AV521_01430 [Streptomyces sp. IMTB 2501]|nr:hypothetical protein AV521_01430 [Streptomyces sp. IMTB 2501]
MGESMRSPSCLRRPRARLPGPRGRPHARHLYQDSAFDWSDFDPGLLDKVRPAFPDLPPAAVALALRIWGHLHGLVSLEVYGHMHTQTTSPEKLFQEELVQLIQTLGIPPRR